MIESNSASLHESELFTIQLPSKTESLVLVEGFAEKIRHQYTIDEDVFANILTCLSEVVINAIIHGNKEASDKMVYINLEVMNGKKLIFTVSDEGDGFNPNDIPDPTNPENIEKLTGRGVFIIKHLADQCIFNSRGNEVELHFKL